MRREKMTSLQRVLTAVQYREPDRVPFFLPADLHGARELQIPIKEYFSKPENVAEGQLRILEKLRHDFVTNFHYLGIELEAWGSEPVFHENGPATPGAPIIKKPEDINKLAVPKVKESLPLLRVLKATELLRARVGDEVPVLGVVLSPFSQPATQMGFDNYIELMYGGQTELFDRLIDVNTKFCVDWANSQLEAGASIIIYIDPVSSTTITPRDMYLKTGFKIMQQAIGQIKGLTIIHMASGRSLPIISEMTKVGASVIGVSTDEDLGELKEACKGKAAVLGNLNGVEMRRWTAGQAETIVRDAIAKAGPGGGYILSDNNGEIPWQIPDEVLVAISEAVYKWGYYPLDWVKDCGR